MNDVECEERLEARITGDPSLPVLVYLPGLHGDWTLIPGFRAALGGRLRLVELTYPRTQTWTLEDYAAAIQEVLIQNGILSCWLLGESFGSQVLWAILRRWESVPAHDRPLQLEGLILAGGFVRYPVIAALRCVRAVFVRTPLMGQNLMRTVMKWYGIVRHRNSPENRRHLDEFVRRRTPKDWLAAGHRLGLIVNSDPLEVAGRTHLPVFHLAGLVDPIVPTLLVRGWLRRHCPGYRQGRTLWLADHNVLGTAPRQSADLIASWVLGERLAGDARYLPETGFSGRLERWESRGQPEFISGCGG
jgi:pimeloyl-ACP methyl ester carboxylesterase